jgi:Plasmid replication region DNA-binding N-term
MEHANQSGPVTVDDVAAACQQAGVTPSQTNAAKIRIILGRGSFATIQKHLDSLRASAIKAQEPTDTAAAPPAPVDLLTGIWSAAYNAAGHQLGGRLMAVLTERDLLREAAAATANDVAALASQVDKLEADTALAQAGQEKSIAERNAAVQSLTDLQKTASDQIAELVAQAEKSTLAAAHQAELAERDKTIERQSLQATIDRLTDQIGEFKSLLSMQARVS